MTNLETGRAGWQVLPDSLEAGGRKILNTV